MIIDEKKAGKMILEKGSVLLPLISLFISGLIIPENEWAAALSALPLAFAYPKKGWERMCLFWWGIGAILAAALVGENGLAVGGYWLIASGVLSLAIAHLRRD